MATPHSLKTNENPQHFAARRAAGLASGAARRAATFERDRQLAIRHARYPGISLAKLGREVGLSRSGVLRAIRRAMEDPGIAADLAAAEAERRESLAAIRSTMRGMRWP